MRGKCSGCGQHHFKWRGQGHFKRDCLELKRQADTGLGHMAFSGREEGALHADRGIIDSGATSTSHMTSHGTINDDRQLDPPVQTKQIITRWDVTFNETAIG
jgi:hypothetical protein